ncbi:MAG: mechanosensitive ion channel [Anaerolineales bacterium]|nr:mechanosensitive ion channel [Anaerolineales bacterium]
MNLYLDNFVQELLHILPEVLIAAAILLVSIYLASLLSRMIKRVLLKRKSDPEVTHLLSLLTRWSIIALGIITALQRFFDVTAFLAGVGILGFTIGFALQNIMENFVAGIILLVQQPFNVKDAIEVNDFGGTILAINIRTTEMQTWDGKIVIIPNSDILSNPITNYTRAKQRRINVPVGVAYGTNLETAHRTLLESVKKIPGILEDPAPTVVTDTFADSSINMTLYFWADMNKVGYFEAVDLAFRQVKAAFEKKGIEIPFPIRTVYTQS